MRVELSGVELVALKKKPKEFFAPSAMWGPSKKTSIDKPGMGPHQIPSLCLDLELPSLQNCDKINFCCLSHSAHGSVNRLRQELYLRVGNKVLQCITFFL